MDAFLGAQEIKEKKLQLTLKIKVHVSFQQGDAVPNQGYILVMGH